MSWSKKSVDPAKVRALSEQLRIHLITASILERRGVHDSGELKFYLESDLAYLHNPFLFDDMESAVDRIFEALTEGEKIRIFGDRDVDGMTSTVLLFEELEALGADVGWCVPEGDEPYGLTVEKVKAFHEADGTLIITVDCGISNTVEIGFANSLGIDTLVIDHHLPGELLPPALAIINPKVPGCGYPFAHLAGCGVTAKLIWALRFAKTDLYKQELVLLHCEPGNDTVVIQAVKIENLLEVDRLTEEIVPGILDIERSRLGDFLLNLPILTFDEKLELRLLRKAFGSSADIHLIDTGSKLIKVFPALQGKSLTRLKALSRSLRYKTGEVQELDSFLSLFIAYVMRTHPPLSTEYQTILDLVAVGTIADLMPMKNENRILVLNGLRQLNSGQRPSLAAFLTEVNLIGKTLSTTDIGWQISPVFNAAGRLGVPQVAVNMLLSKDMTEGSELVRELTKLNRERKKIGENAWDRLLPKAAKSLAAHHDRMIVLDDHKLHRGITGIIATRLMNQFRVPAVVIAHLPEKMIGSVRSGQGLHVKDFLSRFEDILIDYGGHPQAGGFSVEPHNFEAFLKRLYHEAAEIELEEQRLEFHIDAEIPHTYMTPELIEIVEQFEPYGEGHKPLQFLVRDVVLQEASIMGNAQVKHLKLLVKSGAHSWPAVYWKAGNRLDGDFSQGDHVDMIFRLGRNYYRNMESLQLTVVDIARTGSVEIR